MAITLLLSPLLPLILDPQHERNLYARSNVRDSSRQPIVEPGPLENGWLTGGIQVYLACCLILRVEAPVINIVTPGMIRLNHRLKKHGEAARTIALVFVGLLV